jgi:hypothetical protein
MTHTTAALQRMVIILHVSQMVEKGVQTASDEALRGRKQSGDRRDQPVEETWGGEREVNLTVLISGYAARVADQRVSPLSVHRCSKCSDQRKEAPRERINT